MMTAVPHPDRVGLYDDLAQDYDRLHRRWLRHAGGEAQAALEAVVRVLAGPDADLLDAGCGTGAFARALIAEGMAPGRITLMDPSEAMLAHCADIAALKLKGRLEAIPFEDSSFDVVTCAWALETVPSPELALSELCRIVRKGGVLCIAFCADTPAYTVTDWLMRRALMLRGTGRFLPKRFVVETLENCGEFEVRLLPCNGPVGALIARRV